MKLHDDYDLYQFLLELYVKLNETHKDKPFLKEQLLWVQKRLEAQP